MAHADGCAAGAAAPLSPKDEREFKRVGDMLRVLSLPTPPYPEVALAGLRDFKIALENDKDGVGVFALQQDGVRKVAKSAACMAACATPDQLRDLLPDTAWVLYVLSRNVVRHTDLWPIVEAGVGRLLVKATLEYHFPAGLVLDLHERLLIVNAEEAEKDGCLELALTILRPSCPFGMGLAEEHAARVLVQFAAQLPGVAADKCRAQLEWCCKMGTEKTAAHACKAIQLINKRLPDPAHFWGWVDLVVVVMERSRDRAGGSIAAANAALDALISHAHMELPPHLQRQESLVRALKHVHCLHRNDYRLDHSTLHGTVHLADFAALRAWAKARAPPAATRPMPAVPLSADCFSAPLAVAVAGAAASAGPPHPARQPESMGITGATGPCSFSRTMGVVRTVAPTDGPRPHSDCFERRVEDAGDAWLPASFPPAVGVMLPLAAVRETVPADSRAVSDEDVSPADGAHPAGASQRGDPDEDRRFDSWTYGSNAESDGEDDDENANADQDDVATVVDEMPLDEEMATEAPASGDAAWEVASADTRWEDAGEGCILAGGNGCEEGRAAASTGAPSVTTSCASDPPASDGSEGCDDVPSKPLPAWETASPPAEATAAAHNPTIPAAMLAAEPPTPTDKKGGAGGAKGGVGGESEPPLPASREAHKLLWQGADCKPFLAVRIPRFADQYLADACEWGVTAVRDALAAEPRRVMIMPAVAAMPPDWVPPHPGAHLPANAVPFENELADMLAPRPVNETTLRLLRAWLALRSRGGPWAKLGGSFAESLLGEGAPRPSLAAHELALVRSASALTAHWSAGAASTEGWRRVISPVPLSTQGVLALTLFSGQGGDPFESLLPANFPAVEVACALRASARVFMAFKDPPLKPRGAVEVTATARGERIAAMTRAIQTEMEGMTAPLMNNVPLAVAVCVTMRLLQRVVGALRPSASFDAAAEAVACSGLAPFDHDEYARRLRLQAPWDFMADALVAAVDAAFICGWADGPLEARFAQPSLEWLRWVAAAAGVSRLNSAVALAASALDASLSVKGCRLDRGTLCTALASFPATELPQEVRDMVFAADGSAAPALLERARIVCEWRSRQAARTASCPSPSWSVTTRLSHQTVDGWTVEAMRSGVFKRQEAPEWLVRAIAAADIAPEARLLWGHFHSLARRDSAVLALAASRGVSDAGLPRLAPRWLGEPQALALPLFDARAAAAAGATEGDVYTTAEVRMGDWLIVTLWGKGREAHVAHRVLRRVE